MSSITRARLEQYYEEPKRELAGLLGGEFEICQ
jgi:hypothetical protein